jgi:hypothetical protein
VRCPDLAFRNSREGTKHTTGETIDLPPPIWHIKTAQLETANNLVSLCHQFTHYGFEMFHILHGDAGTLFFDIIRKALGKIMLVPSIMIAFEFHHL